MSTVSITSTQGGESAAALPDSRQSPSLAFGSSKICAPPSGTLGDSLCSAVGSATSAAAS